MPTRWVSQLWKKVRHMESRFSMTPSPNGEGHNHLIPWPRSGSPQSPLAPQPEQAADAPWRDCPSGRNPAIAPTPRTLFLAVLRHIRPPGVRADRPERERRRFIRPLRHVQSAGAVSGLLAFVVLALAVANPAPAQAQVSGVEDASNLLEIRFSEDLQLKPSFHTETHDYDVYVPPTLTKVVIFATPFAHPATVQINGVTARQREIALDSERVVVTIHVTSGDRSNFLIYTVTLLKGPQLTHDATLPSGSLLDRIRLSASTEVVKFPGTPVPGKDCGCGTRYRAIVPRDVNMFSVSATPGSGAAWVTSSGHDGSRASRRRVDERVFNLLEGGRNEIILDVQPKDTNVTRQIYRIVVHRADHPPVLQEISHSSDYVVLTYDKALHVSAPPASAFTVTADGTEVQVSQTEVNAQFLSLRMASPVETSSEVRVSYTVPSTNPVQTIKYGRAAAFTNRLAKLWVPEIAVADTTVTEAEGAEAQFLVTMSPRARGPVMVDYATSDGTATAGTDYITTSGTLTIPAGLTTATISVPVLDDSHEDGGETFTLTLSNPRGGNAIGTAILVDATATATINNDESGNSGDSDELTAEFRNVSVDAHDGEAAFTFEVHFSEDVKGLSYMRLRNHAFHVRGGAVTGARRLVQGENQSWEITVVPDSLADVTTILPVTTDCGDDGSICTDDGIMLSNRSEFTVPGPGAQNSPATGAPTISGTAQVGQTLTASTSGITDGNGMTDASFFYQWRRDGADISGATGPTYTATNEDGGHTITVTVSFNDDDGYDESTTSESMAIPRPPLTAELVTDHTSHNGENPFTVKVTFSEQFPISYTTIRDNLLDIENGAVESVSRAHEDDADLHRLWDITIAPGGDDDVVIHLRPTTDCAAAGAICTADNTKLSSNLTLTVAGPQ
ncbi:MAG: hypothetical protein F4X27_16390 [Chloroflexi bacterium]|nr:hypothetical protein [Chloroflexota bacterium]